MSTANGNTDLGLCPSGQSVHILLDLDAFILKKTIYIYIHQKFFSSRANVFRHFSAWPITSAGAAAEFGCSWRFQRSWFGQSRCTSTHTPLCKLTSRIQKTIRSRGWLHWFLPVQLVPSATSGTSHPSATSQTSATCPKTSQHPIL